MDAPGLVGTPVREQVWAPAFESFLALQLPAGSHVQVVPGPRPVPEKRDWIAELLLKVEVWKWLLFLDSDQTFRPDVAERLWATSEATGAGIVAAPVTRRSKRAVRMGGRVNAWRLPDGFEPETPERIGDDPGLRDALEPVYAREIDRDGDPFEVDLVGAGVTLIRRGVLEALDGPPWFPPSRTAQPGLGEDINGVYRARRAGVRVMVDPSVRVGHVGPYAYEVEDGRDAAEPAVAELAGR